MKIKEVLRISRPRFWIYQAATYGLIGALATTRGVAVFSDWKYWLFFVYFLIPTNILIYGVNDIFDYETDKLNPKKGTYEALVSPETQGALWKWIVFTNIPFLFFVPMHTGALWSFAACIFFAVFYSAEPIRAKAKPVIDSLFSAANYVAAGVFGFYMAGGVHFPTLGVIAGMCWAVAMHAYSAVPDIAADKQAGLKTIAILIGKQKTIALCWVLYIVSALLVFPLVPISAVLSIVLFSYLMYRSLGAKTDADLFTLYTYFPTINTAVGMAVSLSLFAKALGL